MKTNLFLLIFLLSTLSIFSQTTRQTVEEEQLWTGYFNQTRLTDKWGFWTDVHYRATEHFIQEPSKGIFRVGLTYYLNDDMKLTNGYAFINHFPEEGHANISQSEHRLWQQLQYHSRFGATRTMNWFRLEERFRHNIKNDNELADGYRFDLRLRSNFLLNIPLSKKGIAPKTFSAILNDEIFVNFPNSKNTTYLPFDQNRFFVGLAYNLDSHSNIQFGYMNVFQQLSVGTKFKNIDAIRIFFFQNFDVRKNKK